VQLLVRMLISRCLASLLTAKSRHIKSNLVVCFSFHFMFIFYVEIIILFYGLYSVVVAVSCCSII